MKRFVNYRKRSIQLPKGCKDLSDLLKASKKPQQGGVSLLKSGHKEKCEYCGAPAAFGWGSGMWSGDGTKHTENHYWCKQCYDDLKEFQWRSESFPPELTSDIDFNDTKAIKALNRWMLEILERREAFMRQRVAERKGPDQAG